MNNLNEIKKTNPLLIASKDIKYLGVNLTVQMITTISWKQTTRPSADEHKKKMWYFLSMEYN